MISLLIAAFSHIARDTFEMRIPKSYGLLTLDRGSWTGDWDAGEEMHPSSAENSRTPADSVRELMPGSRTHKPVSAFLRIGLSSPALPATNT